MSDKPLSSSDPQLPPALVETATAAERYLDAQYSAATRRAYAADWQAFQAFCLHHGLVPLPATPQTVALFLTNQAEEGLLPSTLQRRLAAVRLAHRAATVESPTGSELVKGIMRGIRRTHGIAPTQKAPLLAEQLKALVDGFDLKTAAGVRDRALLLVGFAAALRRSELAALEWADVEWVPQGMRLHIRRSKTDQEASGAVVAVPHGGDYCPVLALRAWRGFLGADTGPTFRGLYRGGTPRPTRLSGYAVALIVQRHARRLGWEVEQYAAHSLRSGWATSAALNGASLAKMREVTRHKSLQTLQLYIRRAEEFTNHAGEGLL